jgi:hypothetical protein
MRGVKPRAPSRPARPPAGRAPVTPRQPAKPPAATPSGPVDFDTLLDRGIDLFNRRRFFEAHDVWEDAWRVSSGDRALFLQGLIQIAAGLVKWQRGQLRGMTGLLAKGAEKLERLGARFEGVDVKGLLGAVGRWDGTAPGSSAARPFHSGPGDPPRIIRQP